MKKCIECGTPHRNRDEKGLNDIRCLNCNIIFQAINAFINSVNMPMSTKHRKLTITGYKIEKL